MSGLGPTNPRRLGGQAVALGPTVAGTWYPADGAALADQIDGFLARARPGPTGEPPDPLSGRIVALLAPHAGYAYSGPVAAGGFRRLRDTRVGRVILIGPSHYASFSGAALPEASIYRTPLGEVPLDAVAIDALAGQPGVQTTDQPFRPEHSLEAEIPFLQRCLQPGWRMLPLLVGAGTRAPGIEQLARALRPWVEADTLLVISSDFTHYGPRFDYVPFREDVPTRIERLDMGAVELVLARDASGFAEYVDRTGATICGRRAIDILLRLLGAQSPGHLAAYDTSGRITGDWSHSVSYASLLFSSSRAEPEPGPTGR